MATPATSAILAESILAHKFFDQTPVANQTCPIFFHEVFCSPKGLRCVTGPPPVKLARVLSFCGPSPVNWGAYLAHKYPQGPIFHSPKCGWS